LPLPETQRPPGGTFLALVNKEWRDILAGPTIWILLLLLSALVGYSYAQQLPEVARSLSPLDGVFVPTFGALYLTNTFLFPFIAIRSKPAASNCFCSCLARSRPSSLPKPLCSWRSG
jgi:hypothetical protein